MPWFYEKLDQDVYNEIKSKNLGKGKFLDLGAGPGMQVIQLSNLGFEVIVSDLSKNAISKTKKLYPGTNYAVDDILTSKFSDNEFDFILDRGVFHVFEQEKLPAYLSQIKRILKKDNLLFLKCMSMEEKNLEDGKGPYLYSMEKINKLFENDFEIESIKNSIYYGTLNPPPKSLFAVMRNKKE